MKLRALFAFLLTATLAVACAGEGTAPDNGGNGGPDISFADDIQPIFTASCALSNCHAGGQPQAGLNLSAGVAYQSIVGVASMQLQSMDRITPGQPDDSYLVHKIQGTQNSVGGTGNRMPLIGCCLSTAQINTIRQWVADGAPNN